MASDLLISLMADVVVTFACAGFCLQVGVRRFVHVPFVLQDMAPWPDSEDGPDLKQLQGLGKHVLVLSGAKFSEDMCNLNFNIAYDFATTNDLSLMKMTRYTCAASLLMESATETRDNIGYLKFHGKERYREYFDLNSFGRSKVLQPLNFLIRTVTPAAAGTPHSTPTARPTVASFTSLKQSQESAHVNLKDVARSSTLKKADEAITEVLKRMRWEGTRKPVGDKAPAVQLPLFRPEVQGELAGSKASEQMLFGDPCEPDFAMNRLNERKVFRANLGALMFSLASSKSFKPPECILALYPAKVYERLAGNVDEDKLFEDIDEDLLLVPIDIEAALTVHKTHVARLIAGNHTYSAAVAIAVSAVEQGRYEKQFFC